eukprot:scaffold2276_cov160-Amphora_coffeaeformis.AAC.11
MATKRWKDRVGISPQITMEDIVESIETLEERLLQGRFRDALASANCRLRSMPLQSETSLRNHEIRSFLLWRKSFQLKIHFETTESDRIGAVALQSWYELWKKEQECEKQIRQPNPRQTKVTNEESRRHLMPFLEVLCLNFNSMSVELAWIWVNLLWTIHERSTSVLLAVQLWKFALTSDNSKGICQLVPDQGLLFFISEVLTHLRLAADDPFWKSWYKADEYSGLETKCKMISHYPTKDALDSLITTFPKFSEHLFLPTAVLEEVKSRLETLSRKLEIERSHSQSSASLGDLSLIPRQGQPPTELLRRIRYKIAGWIRTWVLSGANESAGGSLLSPRDRAVAVSIFVVSAWMTWRNSRNFLQLLKRVLRLAALPARELLEAFIPRQVSNET